MTDTPTTTRKSPRVTQAEVWNYYDGPTVFVGTDAASGQMVCGFLPRDFDPVDDDPREFEVWHLPPDGSPSWRVREDEIEWDPDHRSTRPVTEAD